DPVAGFLRCDRCDQARLVVVLMLDVVAASRRTSVKVGPEPGEDALPMVGISVRGFAAADQAFVAHGQPRTRRDGLESGRDRRPRRSLKRVLLEPARHDQLVWPIDFREFTAPAVRAAVREANRHTPGAANTQISVPVFLPVIIGMAPPLLDLVRGERPEDTVR